MAKSGFTLDVSKRAAKAWDFSLVENVVKAGKVDKIVKVGVLKGGAENYPDYVYKNPDKGTRAGPSVAEVAVWNEFGTTRGDGSPGIPARPFMRQTFTKHDKEIKNLKKFLIKKIMAGTYTVDQALEILGKHVADFIRETMATGKFVPNTEATIAKKGAGKRPLLDTGHLSQSIMHSVESNDGNT